MGPTNDSYPQVQGSCCALLTRSTGRSTLPNNQNSTQVEDQTREEGNASSSFFRCQPIAHLSQRDTLPLTQRTQRSSPLLSRASFVQQTPAPVPRRTQRLNALLSSTKARTPVAQRHREPCSSTPMPQRTVTRPAHKRKQPSCLLSFRFSLKLKQANQSKPPCRPLLSLSLSRSRSLSRSIQRRSLLLLSFPERP